MGRGAVHDSSELGIDVLAMSRPATTLSVSAANPEKAVHAVLDAFVAPLPANDVLNARAQPNAAAGKVFELAPASGGWTAANRAGVAGSEWLELQRPSGNGWVNQAFLVEEQPNPCANPHVGMLVRQFVTAVQSADGSDSGAAARRPATCRARRLARWAAGCGSSVHGWRVGWC